MRIIPLNTTIFYLSTLLLSACNTDKTPVARENTIQYNTSLMITEEKLIFEVDSVTSSTSTCLYTHEIDGARFLSYLNKNQNEIIIYNIDTRQEVLKVKPKKMGPNGVGLINGFHIATLDSIYICPKSKKSIYIINRESQIIRTINYGKKTKASCPTPKSATSLPLVIDNGRILIPSSPFGNWNNYSTLSNIPVCYSINLDSGKGTFLEMNYPENYIKKGNVEPTFSRIYVGGNFIYSFFGDHNVYSTKSHKVINTKWAGSKFFSDFKYLKKNLDMQEYLRYRSETPYYSGIVYDPYRNVYYRFTSLGNKVASNDNLSLIAKFPPNTSIIILDSLLNVIGEKKLPYGRFNISNSFVTKEGLFLSENTPLNSAFSDDHLHFTSLKLMNNEN